MERLPPFQWSEMENIILIVLFFNFESHWLDRPFIFVRLQYFKSRWCLFLYKNKQTRNIYKRTRTIANGTFLSRRSYTGRNGMQVTTSVGINDNDMMATHKEISSIKKEWGKQKCNNHVVYILCHLPGFSFWETL